MLQLPPLRDKENSKKSETTCLSNNDLSLKKLFIKNDSFFTFLKFDNLIYFLHYFLSKLLFIPQRKVKKREMSILTGTIKEAFAGIKPSWKHLFLNELKPQVNACFRKLNARLIKLGVTYEMVEKNGLETYIRPAPADIFRAFKYCEIDNIRCVIVGQDPYPNADSAQGLSFSVPLKQKKIPSSLLKIYDCLQEQGHISERPAHGHLAKWAKQGVLLINRYLTRNPTIVDDGDGPEVKGDGGSDKGNMHTFWEEFTDGIVKHLAARAEKKQSYLCIMLWGDKAQDMSGAISDEILRNFNRDVKIVDVQTWGHPSGLSRVNQVPGPKNFINCDHFTHINEELTSRKMTPIDWNPVETAKIVPKTAEKVSAVKANAPAPKVVKTKLQKIIVFTDGGCTGNGKKHAKASYGVSFPKTFQNAANGIAYEAYGLVPLTELGGKNEVQPSNNRGEMLAMIRAFERILLEDTIGPILVVTDSEYCMHIVNERIWKWVKKDKNFKEYANPDMLKVLYAQLLELQKKYGEQPLLQPAAATHYAKKTPMDLKWPGLTILHQNSHLKDHEIPKDAFGKEVYGGNVRADELCNLSFSLNDYEIHH